MSARSPRQLLPTRHGGRRALVVALGACVLSLIGIAGKDAAGEQASNFKIIVHPDNPSAGEERQFFANAFLKNVTEWSDGRTIQPVDQHRDSAVRAHFSQRIIRRSVAAVRNYWQQKIFSGRGVPPPELDSDQAVISYVLRQRGAVGYVSGNADVGRARVIAVR